ncbi:SDR family oxidoreductase [Ferrovibrio sp.]|uniref:SDR family oxidoreductase n=1 Tax=Ferrovibrio sp. TaxID=1917215 RepID=UPI002636028D|nr:SDR family oxidoreductase [Ferrovibrio sp.]
MAENQMFRDGLLAGKRILVTGGGTGLGRAIAEHYLSLGATVWICGRRQAPLDATVKELSQAHGARIRAQSADIRDPEQVNRLMETVSSEGPLTGLVNNAAGNFISPTHLVSPRGFDAVANTVLHGTFYVTNAVGKRWIEAGLPGAIISILTTWVWTGSPFTVPSAMAKTGLDAMTKSLAIEWGRNKIRVNAIAPGVIPTEGMSARLDPGGDSNDRGSENPWGRVGRPSELQNLATFLMADGCEWLSGQTIALDGAGYLANGTQMTRYFGLSDADWAEKKKIARQADTAGRNA